MKINYIISDTTKSATTKTLSQVILRAEKDIYSNFVVIVPETKSIIIEKELLALSKSGAFANIFVYSFVRLLDRLGYVEKDKIISKQTAIVLIRKIIFENIDNLKCYKKTAKNISFAEKIYDTLQQFKSSEVSVQDLKLALESANGALKSKLDDIILIYEAYEKLLGEALFDDCDKLNLIKKFSKTSDFIKNSEVFVVGFDNITPEMVSVLEELAKTSKEITFSSVYFSEKREDKYIQKNELFFKFRRVADNLKFPYVPTLSSSHKKGDFYVVANNLFALTVKPAKYNGDIKVFTAASKEQEIRFVASKIAEMVEDGARFKDFGVMVLDIENDKQIIKEIFDEFNINYFINQEIEISNHYLISFLKLCYELYFSHLSSDKVVKFVKSKLINLDNTAEFENFVNEFGFNYNEFLKPLSDEFKKCKEFEVISNILIEFQKFYHQFEKKIKNAKTASEFAEVILFVIEYFDIRSRLEGISEYELSVGLREESQISRKILSKVEEFLKMLCNFIGNMSVSAEEFLQIFLSGFSSIKLNIVPVSIDCVVVQNNTDGFFNIKNMFIVGADEDKFPTAIQDSGIILDDELEMTNILSGKTIEPTTKEINAREKFSAYEALLEPSEKLFISYSKQSLDGSQKKPSTIIKKLALLFGDTLFIKNFKQSKFISKAVFEKEFARNISSYHNGLYLLSEINDEYNYLKGNISERFDNYLKNKCQSKPSFEIENANELYFVGGKTSASQLEKYFLCPYQFFASYGLRLKENKNAKLSKLDIGIILHKVAELFVKNIKNFNCDDENLVDKKIQEFIENIFDKLNLKKASNKAAIKFILKESKRLCNYILIEQKNSGFKAKYNEFVFNSKNAIELKLQNNEKVFIEGKIDRIDEFGDYVRIIDYKTGDIESDLFSIYFGKKIQLVTYLSAISEIKNKKIAGLFYLPIHSDFVKNKENVQEKYKMNGFLLKDIDVIKNMDYTLSFDSPKSRFVPITIKTNDDVKNRNVFEISRAGQKFLLEEEFENLKKYNEELCKKASEEIMQGFIEPSPFRKGDDKDSMPCAWCEFAGFCGKENARYGNGRRCESSVSIETFSDKT